MSQRGKDPAFYLQNTRFDFRLVPSFFDPGRDNDGPIMFGQLPIRGVEVGFIAAGARDGIPEVVGDEDLRGSLEEFESMNMGLNPGREVLGESGLGKGVVARPQRGHKDLGLVNLSGLGLSDLHGLAGVIDEELFSGPIFLAEAGIQFSGPWMVKTAELAVLVPFEILLLVFMPKKLKGNALPLYLLVKILRARHLTLFLRNRMNGREQPMLQRGLIKLRRKRPTHSRSLSPVKVISDRTPANIKTLGNLSG